MSAQHFDIPDLTKLEPTKISTLLPGILLLYGSCRERSYIRLLTRRRIRK